MNQVVEKTVAAVQMDMGGFPIHQALPAGGLDHIDPFLLLHHGKIDVKAGSAALHSGVGPHPHRGFSAVSILVGGEVHHRDSLGNSSVVGAGGVQWVQSGRGIVHSERPSEELAVKGGSMELIQLWINTPASQKMAPAAYFAVKANEIKKVSLAEDAEMHLISGEYAGESGNIPPQSPLLLSRIRAGKGASFSLSLNNSFSTALYLISGSARLKGHGMLEAKHLYALREGIDAIELADIENLDLLLMSGKALDEPLATYGPFVMNNQTQIMEAMRDYQMGKMGVLIEE